MLIDRPQVVEGSSIQNATVPSGASFPSSPNPGELFFLTSGNVGLHVYSGSTWEASAKDADLDVHVADDSRHLTSAQNTLLDATTVSASDLNSIPAVTARLTTAEGTLASHLVDDSRHLTATQNTFMDGLNLPTLTAAHVNFVAGTTSNLQGQLNAIVGVNTTQSTDISNLQTQVSNGQTSIQNQLNTHIADDTRHLTIAQNTFLDGITVDFAQVNKLVGLTDYLGSGTLTQVLSILDNSKLNINGTNVMTGNLNVGGQRVVNVATPVAGSDVATKDYVDNFVQGLHWVGSARVATLANIPLSGLQTIDGYALSVGERVLVKNQTDPAQNGIWTANNAAWARANDFNSPLEINTSAVFVLNGVEQGKSTWIQLNTVNTVGGDPIAWSAFSGPVINSAGAGIALGTGGAVSIVQGYGLTFDGNALVTDIHPAGGLMTTADNAVSSFQPGAQLALTNVGVGGTYRSVTTDAKGRVTAGTNPTTISGYGLTDAVNKTGDTMTGALMVGTTRISATTPTVDSAWLYTGSYGTEGDGRTYFGYRTSGGQWINYIRGSTSNFEGNISVGATANIYVNGSAVWTQASLTKTSQLINDSGFIGSSNVTWANVSGKPVRNNWVETNAMETTVGQLVWKNYGNGHTIFDASAGTNPIGGTISNTVPDNVWSPTYPTLMGFNGAQTYGVRVDSARISDFASATNRLYASDTAYAYGSASPYFLQMNYTGTRWRLSASPAAPGAVEVAHADTATNATMAADSTKLGGIVAQQTMQKRRSSIQDIQGTSLNSSITAPEMGFTYGGSGEPPGPFIAFGGLGSNIDYSCQLVGAYGSGGNQFVIRTRNDDTQTWNPWRNILTDGNYMMLAGQLSGPNDWIGRNRFISNKGATSYIGTSSDYSLQICSSDNGGAGMSFHRIGHYAVNMGLDLDNVLRIGGWSAGANRWALDMSGNMSVAGTITAPGNITTSGNFVSSNYGGGLVGVYDSAKFESIFSMGPAYTPPVDGSGLGNQYGLSWTHSNAGGQAIPALAHQLLVVEAGVTKVSIGSGIYNAFAYRGATPGSNYGSIKVTGTNSGYTGIYMSDAVGSVTGMFDTSGNGGDWDPTTSWHFYWNRAHSCLAVGGTVTLANYKLHVNGNAYVAGNIEATGDVAAFSDLRLKSNVQTIQNAGEKVAALRGVTFKRINDGSKGTGLIAQDVIEVAPEAVHTNEDGIMSVAYGNLVGLLVESIKELQAEVKALKEQVNRPRHESS